MTRSCLLRLVSGGRPQRHTMFGLGCHASPVVMDRWGLFEHRSLGSMSSTLQDVHDLLSSPYSRPVEAIRKDEYPHMQNGIYLDHSGTTIYARSTVERFSEKMRSGLYGNPHSANEPAKMSGDMVDEVRMRALRFSGADPRHFDLVFVANSTAAIKLVADSFRDLAEQTRSGSFWYGYHRDAHTSIVGVRELTNGDHRCFASDSEVEAWLDNPTDPSHYHPPERTTPKTRRHHHHPSSPSPSTLRLFGYPGQSNLTGRRLPLSWTRRIRHTKTLQNTYTLLDAAALAMTSPLAPIFADPDGAPDFCCVSFYKIFGFPDLGGLIVRRDSGHILALRRYFGGGTVSLVGTLGGAWHTSKGLEHHTSGVVDGLGQGGGLHEGLEDGTLPFHSILALGEAIDVHGELYGSMENISGHTSRLVGRLYEGIRGLRYANGQPLCKVYCGEEGEGEEGMVPPYGDPKRQGATVAFNVFREDGGYESYATVEKMANERGVFIRSGGVCCPGGVYAALQYEPWQLNRARSAGHHCGPDGLGVINDLPTGIVRASLGAMSTTKDVDGFISFLRDSFLDNQSVPVGSTTASSSGSESHPEAECDVGFEYREQRPAAAVAH